MMYKSTKCNYFPFVFILCELASYWKFTRVRGRSKAGCSVQRFGRLSSSCHWMKTTQYSFVIRGSLMFNDTDTFAVFLFKSSQWNRITFITPPPTSVTVRWFTNHTRGLRVNKSRRHFLDIKFVTPCWKATNYSLWKLHTTLHWFYIYVIEKDVK